MTGDYRIKELEANHLQEAMRLVWKVFLEFEAPEYSEEGIREFRDFIDLSGVEEMRSRSELLLWGCFDGDQIIGVIASKPPCHIALLFVDKSYHRQGIARTLFRTVLEYYKAGGGPREMTVNSSPYAVEAYRKLGFVETDTEQTVNGIRFIPMRHTFRQEEETR